MTDLATGGGIYRDVTDARRNELVRRSVELINKHVLAAVVISCQSREVNSLAPNNVRGLRDAYSICCHMAMTQVKMWLRDTVRRDDRVAYVFDAGNTFQAETSGLISSAGPHDADPYRYYSHAFVPRDDLPALQAADLLAWEWTKFLDETVSRPIRRMRGALRSLIASDPSRYIGSHITGQPLRRFFTDIRKAICQQLESEAALRDGVFVPPTSPRFPI